MTVRVLPLPTVPDLVSPPRPLALRSDGFATWLKTARPGRLIEYHRSHLCVDRQQKPDAPNNEARAALHRLATRVLRAAEQDLVHLVQRRHGPEDFSYLAIKAGKTPRARHHGSRSPRRAA